MNLGQYSISAAQPGLSAERIMQLPIPVPPPPEQQAIATFLDRETARIGALIGGVNVPSDSPPTSLFGRHITLLMEYRSALISAAVTGQIDVRGVVI